MNLLKNMQAKGLGTKDAEVMAMRLNRTKSERNPKIVKDVMKWKIEDAENDVKKIKKEYLQARNDLRECVPYRSLPGRWFGWLTVKVVNEEWNAGKMRNSRKLRNTQEKD